MAVRLSRSGRLVSIWNLALLHAVDNRQHFEMQTAMAGRRSSETSKG
jgi:hypothetical protein